MQRLLPIVLLLILSACDAGKQAQTGLPQQPTQAAAEATTEPQPAVPSAAPTSGAGIVIVPSLEDGGIWAVDPEANQLYQLADATAPGQLLPWGISPDGETLAVIVFSGPTPKNAQLTSSELWLVNTDESNPHPLLNLLPADGIESTNDLLRANDLISGLILQQRQPLIWTSANEIVLVSLHEGQPDIYAVAADSGAVRRLTNTSEIEFSLELAPNGQTIAYASVSSFGTGAGFGDPEIWLQDLGGEPRPALPAETTAAFDGLGLHGWANDQLIVSGFSQLGAGHTLFIVNRDGSVESPDIPAGTLAIDASSDATIISLSEVVGESNRTLLWNGNELTQIAETGFPHLIISPDRQWIYGCAQYPGGAMARQIITINGGSIQLDDGVCGAAVWSPDSAWLAIGSTADLNQEGFIVNTQGETIATLSFGALPVGWDGGELLYFLPENAGWQLYRRSPHETSNGTKVGQPLPVLPHQPTYLQH